MRITVRLTPRGGRDAVDGWSDWNGARVLKARVSAAPESGRANAALIALLADALDIPKSTIHIAGGETARLKTIDIAGDVAERLARIGAAK